MNEMGINGKMKAERKERCNETEASLYVLSAFVGICTSISSLVKLTKHLNE